MRLSNFLERKPEEKKAKKVSNLKKYRKPIKIIIDENKFCPTCEKHKFTIIYKRYLDEISGYMCVFCGDSIIVKEKGKDIIEELDHFVNDVSLECPIGETKGCLKNSCTFYGNECKIK